MARRNTRIVKPTALTIKDIEKLLKPVTSSNIKAMAYERTNLYVKYMNESIYLFKDISKEIFEDILKASSVGKALAALKLKGEKVAI